MKMITPENLLKSFTALPHEAQKEAMHFIEFLQTRYSPVTENEISNTSKVEDELFIGIWRDREGMQDSSEWVRNQRKQEWS